MNPRIDHSNYEAWLLDRLEGTLSPEQERELDAFLALHPDLAPDLDELPTVGGMQDRLTALEKDALKRTLPPVGAPTAATIDDHLVARLEGDLTAPQLEALRRYLEEHPEYQRAERIYALSKLVPEAMEFAARRTLERQIPPTGMPAPYTLGDFLIARLEGDLSMEQEAELERYLGSHPEARREWALVQATRVPSHQLVFPGKQALKKGGKVIPIGAPTWAIRLAAAASVAILLGVGIWFLRSPGTEAPDLARVEKPLPPAEVAPRTRSTRPAEEVLPPGPGAAPQASGTTGVQQQPRRNAPTTAPVPVPAPVPVEREEQEMMAELPKEEPQGPMNARPELPGPTPTPEEVVAQVDEGAVMANRADPAAPRSTTVGELLAATLRERVLEKQAPDARPLNSDDAVAAVDRGLKAVGGDRAGLEVGRKEDGRLSSFNLRLGRNLAISASR